ncbi:hypothetical protein A4A49_40753 [Nicotiana attenuata]|uniref:Putative plant transposon protein domain-containing protein n=1 Tax=Nicotiana attenuata TaxID=49451 RepID=A0A1J6K7X3_NICAT|nr:hypothetical protein A4A49_40753 [Nicotiana attenuata]
MSHQSKSSKQSDLKDKGKQKVIAESDSESDSDDELTHVDMSDEDEGEPIDRAAWEKKFVSEKAFRAYDKILGSKKYIPEKPINIGALKKKYPDFLKSIREVQQWGPILKGHGKANLTIVQNLYANWRHSRGSIVRVPGVDINISAEALNNFLGVPHTLTDKFDSMCKAPYYSHIKFVLCPTRKDADWKHGSVKYHSLAKELISAFAHVVLNFLCNRLMPCQHKIDRALVLYALLEGIPLNLRVIMHDQMHHTRMNYKLRLFFANTLSAYLTETGVIWDKENDDIKAKAPRPYDVTHVLEPNKGRSSKLTIKQLFEQLQIDMQENRAELIATRAELSATRAELIQTRLETTSVVNGTGMNVIVATGDRAGIKDAKLPTNLVENRATVGVQAARLRAGTIVDRVDVMEVEYAVSTGSKAGNVEAKHPQSAIGMEQAFSGIVKHTGALNAPVDSAASRFGATVYATEGANIKGATGLHDKGDDRQVLQISRSNCE